MKHRAGAGVVRPNRTHALGDYGSTVSLASYRM